MITIYLPRNFLPERRYIIDVMIRHYLGLDYQLCEEEGLNGCKIVLSEKKLLINDSFFNQQSEVKGYLYKENVPANLAVFNSKEWGCQSLPVIYGSPEIIAEDHSIVCNIDIFASAFFMLTRWEEHVSEERDSHDRFPLKNSLAYKHKFHQRPIVNEYCELLKMLILKINPQQVFKKHTFKCVPTHDVDHLYKWKNLSTVRKKLAHNFLTQGNIKDGLRNTLDFLKVKFLGKEDPYQSFRYIVELSIKYSIKSRFYFMSGGTSKVDNNYKLDEARKIIQYLQDNDQIIGIHPSYNSYMDPIQWGSEKKALEKIIGNNTVHEGRQHYLRFRVPDTWNIWESHQMTTDSTMGYSEIPGFRCGTCWPFPVFDVAEQKVLSLIENPLIFMETSVIQHMKLSPEEAYQHTKKLYFTVKKYDGNFTFLWHNSAMLTVEDAPYLFIYENIIKGFPE